MSTLSAEAPAAAAVAAAAAAALPAPSSAFTASISGRDTDFLITCYTDRVMVVATQLGTLGTVLHAEKETVLGGGSTYRVDTLLGRRDEPLAELCARQLAERLSDAGCASPLLLCLALDRGALTLQGVQQVVQQVMQQRTAW